MCSAALFRSQPATGYLHRVKLDPAVQRRDSRLKVTTRLQVFSCAQRTHRRGKRKFINREETEVPSVRGAHRNRSAPPVDRCDRWRTAAGLEHGRRGTAGRRSRSRRVAEVPTHRMWRTQKKKFLIAQKGVGRSDSCGQMAAPAREYVPNTSRTDENSLTRSKDEMMRRRTDGIRTLASIFDRPQEPSDARAIFIVYAEAAAVFRLSLSSIQ
jgi:hypothetical protein